MWESVVSMFEIVKNIGGWVGYLNDLEGNMQNLKTQIEYLSAQKSDIEAEISSTEDRPRKRLKTEVEVWLRDVPRLKNDVQRLDQEVVERSVFSRLWLGNRISAKIEEATKLQEKGKAFNSLQVDEPIGRLLMPPTEDFVETTDARNVERVWECLRNDEVRRVGVFGMSGVGKTTIMKHIHNQLLKETEKFDSIFWVRVSKAFNVTELQREIAKELKVRISDDEDVMRRALELYAVLSQRKRYVLILDDVCEAFRLEMVGIPEPTQCNGCKLVLTTSSLEACRRMGCTTVQVELLTEEEALMLFLRKAIGHDTELAPKVKEIAYKISRECARLPLAIVAVGGSLRGLKRICEWRNALNELISSTKGMNNGEREVFERLKFSYSRLRDEVLQDCFLYCSLYPENWNIPVYELMEYWIAEGLIPEMNSVEAKFDRGHAILGKLTSSCLLESFTANDGLEYVKMHNLIRHMALSITTCSPRFTVKAGVRLESVPYEVWSGDPHRVSLMYSEIGELPSRPPVCPQLTTLLLNSSCLWVIPDSFFTNMHRLEVLDLSENRIKSLPESISYLKNLLAVILKDCVQLEYVPSLKKLKALKEFKLTNSRIEEVPEGIEELVDLRKFDLSNNNRLGTFPSWKLRSLSKLQYLRIDGTRVEVLEEDLLYLRQLKVVAVHFHNVHELTRYVTSQQFQGLEKYALILGKHPLSVLDLRKEDLHKNMQNLKRKVEYLSGQEDGINSKISTAKRPPSKRPEKEVQQFKDDVRMLEQEVVGETNVFSRISLGKDIANKILEVSELQETGGLLIPPTKDFVESTQATNTEKVWECLMNDDVRQIGVYGMGGVGKTTIMKHIHNQLLEKKGKFGNVYWVTVSKAFSITKLQSDIAKALKLSFEEDEDETMRASELYATLSRQKRYVLILDDLWEPFALERVGIPDPMRSNECKIVLTTRSLEVCRRMGCTAVKVELLTQQEALTLFLKKAVRTGTVLAPEVEEIAAKIAKECACLPLAVVTVAASLRGLEGTREWRDALNDLISWKDSSVGESDVLERLKVSYDLLGNKVLQDCFLYCSLYPEGHLIPVNELIEYWIAEELIADMNSVEAQFDKGYAILGKLTSSCLLQIESSIDEDGDDCVRIHDLVRDMALRIIASSPRFMVKAGERITSVPYEHWFEDLQRISFMHSWISELPIVPPICPRLTTFLLNQTLLLEIADCFFTHMWCLKVLDLSNNYLKSLPESISNLENLHSLILAKCCELMNVPSLSKLKALKVFKLTSSQIGELPEGIEELVNLRKLDLSGNERLGTFPSWKLRRLLKLQYLRIDGTRVEVSAEDLMCLRQLKVVAVHFHNVQELSRYLTSQQFQGLEKYSLTVGEHRLSSPQQFQGLKKYSRIVGSGSSNALL